MTGQNPREQLTSQAITVWLGAVLVYIAAICGRTSFGVAGVDAIERFNVDASRIAVFTAVQVGVYALAQIPVGVLIDRLGSRFMIVAGSLVMAVGQVILGLTDSYPVAIFARVLIGAGDSTAFLSALRLLPFWFPLKHTPLFTQLTASLGQLGQFLSAIPFLALLHAQGWTISFVSLGAAGALIGIVAAIAVADSPESNALSRAEKAERAASAKASREPVSAVLAAVMRSPLCWEAFCIHGFSMFFMLNFTLLWGMPLMTLGMGLTPAQGGAALTVYTVATMLSAPVLGPLSARAGKNRDLAAAAIATVHCAVWVWFFLSSEPRGYAFILALMVLLGFATPTSNFGFDTVREELPRSIVATGTGLGNMGGFTAAMLSSQVVGIILDHSAPSGDYTWADFRTAWIAVFAIWGALMIGLAITRHLAVQNRHRGGGGVRVINRG
ncbi:putative sulfoacetate transporter SauU [Corynebacterium capitovis DSM 44611]|uniref:MFS transporter n=1 Tax=Corynebacterium capitovis TaxID=131081 RepID=UPI0003683C38|nr:MFS transporter [Corynebacterium capitovis]WKD57303.1 putative sulfoacetate transporter SauU [Corynebacterium capitovis DSM 44611]